MRTPVATVADVFPNSIDGWCALQDRITALTAKIKALDEAPADEKDLVLVGLLKEKIKVRQAEVDELTARLQKQEQIVKAETDRPTARLASSVGRSVF